jgi:hypothetical protein
MLTPEQIKVCDEIKSLYLVGSRNKCAEKLSEHLECAKKLFYSLMIDWAKAKGTDVFCRAENIYLPGWYDTPNFYVQNVGIWNNVGAMKGGKTWLNKVMVDVTIGLPGFYGYVRAGAGKVLSTSIRTHKATTDPVFLQPFASEFCEFVKDVVVYLRSEQ